jgi:hypothetical protein
MNCICGEPREINPRSHKVLKYCKLCKCDAVRRYLELKIHNKCKCGEDSFTSVYCEKCRARRRECARNKHPYIYGICACGAKCDYKGHKPYKNCLQCRDRNRRLYRERKNMNR